VVAYILPIRVIKKIYPEIILSKGVRLVPKIADSIFKSNQAEIGGAIFVGNQPLYFQSSTFDSNSARDGGAIASFSESIELIIILILSFQFLKLLQLAKLYLKTIKLMLEQL